MTAPSDTSVRVVSFGCRLNHAESDAIRDLAEQAGRSNAIVVNTCAVTREAQRQARQTIRRLRRENPDAHLTVTGCAAQIDPKLFASMPEVSEVLGNREKLDLHAYAAKSNPSRVNVSDIFSERDKADALKVTLSSRTRSFVQIQTGCDHRCTFCVIPYGRGNAQSVPTKNIVERIRQLIDLGHKEVVLTGVDLTSYGNELSDDTNLGRLVETILDSCPKLPRLRLSSIDSIEVDDRLFDLITGNERLMPHLHLSLQSGDPIILKRMKRRHTPAQAVDFCHRLRDRRPEIELGADFIAGFPTETDDMFDNTLRHAAECGITFLHVFPFSAHPQTPAAKMPQVPNHTIKERSARFRRFGEQQLSAHLDRKIGNTDEVLIERGGRGRGRDYTPFQVNRSGRVGEIVAVRALSVANGQVVAEQT